MTIREFEGGMLYHITLREVTIKRCPGGYKLDFFKSMRGAGAFGYESAIIADLRDAIGHAELWCGLICLPDPDPRPKFFVVPSYGAAQFADRYDRSRDVSWFSLEAGA